MDDLGDDSVQVALRVSQQMFSEWRHSARTNTHERTKTVVASELKRGLDGTSEDVRRVEPNSVGDGASAARAQNGRDPGWERVTLDASDKEGIEADLASRGVNVMFYERFDGDVDVLFRAADENAVSEALEAIITDAAKGREHDPLDEQIAEAKEAESSRERTRVAAKSRNLSQEVSR